MPKLRHIVLIGLDFDSMRATGDKNFWLELLHHIAPELDRVSVISLKNKDVDREELQLGSCRVEVRYVPTTLIDRPEVPKGVFPRRLGLAEKTLKASRIAEELADIWREEPYQHVHLMDNLGPANRLVARGAASRLSVTAYTYQGLRPASAYDLFLRASYSHDRITVVPYSRAYLYKLLRLGLRPDHVTRISWGVGPQTGVHNPRDAKRRPSVLWSGYIHPVGRPDFFMAIGAASRALRLGLKADFTFAFKEECFEDAFRWLDRPASGISVRATSPDEFVELQESADIFYSPVEASDIILAPPLTWLEMLSRGVPIVTTDVPGASEAVCDGTTGYLARNEDDISQCLFLASNTYSSMRSECREHVRREYDIVQSSSRYLELWRELADAA